MTVEQIRGPKINLFKCSKTIKQEPREASLAELLHKMQALRTKIVVLREQCEEVKATIKIKPKNQDSYSKCGQLNKIRPSSRIQRRSGQEMLGKNCFTERDE